MKQRARLSQLASRMAESGKTDIGNTKSGNAIDPNPPHGDKGDFRKVTVTLPPAVYEMLIQESFRRKMAREPNSLLASIVRECVVTCLTGKTKAGQ
jgi:transcriptional regulator of met regulon